MVKHSGSTYLTYLLCLFHVLCWFAASLIKVKMKKNSKYSVHLICCNFFESGVELFYRRLQTNQMRQRLLIAVWFYVHDTGIFYPQVTVNEHSDLAYCSHMQLCIEQVHKNVKYHCTVFQICGQSGSICCRWICRLCTSHSVFICFGNSVFFGNELHKCVVGTQLIFYLNANWIFWCVCCLSWYLFLFLASICSCSYTMYLK